MRTFVVRCFAMTAVLATGAAEAGELAYLRVPAGPPVPLYATLPATGEGDAMIPPGGIMTVDAALLESGWVFVVTLANSYGLPRRLSGFIELGRLDRVEPEMHPNGLPTAGVCEAEQPYRGLSWSAQAANVGIGMAYDHTMSILVPPRGTSPPVLLAYRGRDQAVLALYPADLCTMPNGGAGIAGTIATTVDGQSSVRTGCCTANLGAF